MLIWKTRPTRHGGTTRAHTRKRAKRKPSRIPHFSLIPPPHARSVLVLKKLGDDLLPQMMAALRFLRLQEGLRCVVERDVYDRLSCEDGFGFVETLYKAPHHAHADGAAGAALAASVDFVVCLGGDGVILHASTLFNNGAAPPIISFHLGSLGFLTSHTFENFEHDIRGLMYGDAPMDGTGKRKKNGSGMWAIDARARDALFAMRIARKKQHAQCAR